MRAGPLSDAKVIELLNRHFVPVYLVNEDYRKDGPAPAAEKAEADRIYRAALAAGLSAGSVHAYIVTTGGQPVDSLHVAEAAKTETLRAMLERNIERLKAPAGKPLVPRARQSVPPKASNYALVLHLTARGSPTNSWNDFPAEDWIVLDPYERKSFLPPAGAAVGASWEIPRATAAKILARFYPQTENNDVRTNRLDEVSLAATLAAREGGRARVRLAGRLVMKHAFYPGRDDDNFSRAEVAGFADCDEDRIAAFYLVTEKATYGKGDMHVAVRSAR
jgi:hypothetical protein